MTIAFVGGVIYYIEDKNKKKDNSEVVLEIPKCVADYNDSVVAYLVVLAIFTVSRDIIIAGDGFASAL